MNWGMSNNKKIGVDGFKKIFNMCYSVSATIRDSRTMPEEFFKGFRVWINDVSKTGDETCGDRRERQQSRFLL